MSHNVKLGTDIITFFSLGFWGLPEMSHEEWIDTVYRNPKFYFDRMLDGVKDAGLSGVELAPAPGGWEGALKAYGSAPAVADELRRRGLELGSSYMDGGRLIQSVLDDPAMLRIAQNEVSRHAELVTSLDGHVIVMGTIPRVQFTGDYHAKLPKEAAARVADVVNALAEVAAPSQVKIALHTDAYSVCSRNADIDAMMELTDPENVGLCLDAGHTTLDGGDAVEVLRAHVSRTPVMHWKDCVGPLDGSTLTGTLFERHDVMLKSFRVLGSGVVNWHEWQRILSAASWRGWAMAEIDMSPDPIGEIREGLEFFARELSPIYA